MARAFVSVALLVLGALALPAPLAAQSSKAASGTGTLPELPVVEVKPRPVHTVNEDALPPPVRRSSTQPITAAPAASAPSFTPSPGPSSWTAAVAPSPSAPRATGAVSGAAQPNGPIELTVAGKAVRLFGIRAPESRDRCGARDAPSPCIELARNFLARRLGPGGTVSCDVPLRPGSAICRDRHGVDLASLLVNEGLALSEPSESYDYVHAESSARTQKRGLWLYR
jgi:endonuclease YncB( thermonuclease family)